MFDEAILLGIGGWLNADEARCLYEHALRAEGLIVELGAWMGRSTYALAWAVKDSGKPPVVTVDRFTGSEEHRKGSPTGEVWTFPEYYGNMKRCGVLPHVITVIAETVDAARLFPDGSVGLLWHDASHDAESITKDFDAWLPKLRRDGEVIMHDIGVGDAIRCSRERLVHVEEQPVVINRYVLRT